MTRFTHSQRGDVLQHVLMNLVTERPFAILFGRVHGEPRQHGIERHFNLRLGSDDSTGLHCTTRESTELHINDRVMALAIMHPRPRPRRSGPNPVFRVVWLAVSD